METSSIVEIDKFNGQNFELWKLKMEYLLVDKEQWAVVHPGTKPTTMSKEDCDKLDRKVRSIIFLYILDSILLNFSREVSAKNMWEKLGKYHSKSLVNKLFL